MASLGDDFLLEEVISRLPLKPLTKFKSVSQPWHRLISECIRGKDPLILSAVFFTSKDTAMPRSPRYGTISNASFTPYDLTLLPFNQTSSLIDSCNGLLLFASCFPATFHVCNTSTHRWVLLPMPRKQTQLSVLAFDPSLSPHYKVICFTGWRAKGAELEVYSSETGKWAEREVYWAGLDNDAITATMSYLDGALHILAYPQSMVRVDLDEMSCKSIRLPEPVTREGCMGMCGGRVHYSSNHGEKVRVWMLEDWDTCKWVMKHCIERECDYGFSILGFHPEKEVVYAGVGRKVVGYDMGERRLEEVCEIGEEMEDGCLVQIWLFPFSRYMSDCLTVGE